MVQSRTRIKMCGTTRQADAHAAVGAGVDALGFIFVRKSPRCVSAEQAAAIIATLPPFVASVGVFVDSPREEIEYLATACGLTHIQLHGSESPEFCRDLKRWRSSCSICKAFRIGAASPPLDLSRYRSAIDSILLDTYAESAAGGTGRCFDWRLIETLDLEWPLILAGGLTPENVQAAVRQVAPYAIDINSGVESSPGIKDHQKIAELVARVRAVDPSPSTPG